MNQIDYQRKVIREEYIEVSSVKVKETFKYIKMKPKIPSIKSQKTRYKFYDK